MAPHPPALGALESPLGWMPRHDDLEWSGLGLTPDRFEGLMELDREAWLREPALHQELCAKLDNHLPEEFLLKHESLLASLRRAPGRWASH
jgi:phosphoenolpyruvate carboxykinase (GTP)